MNLRSGRSAGGTHQFIPFMLFGGLVALINWRGRIALSNLMKLAGAGHCWHIASEWPLAFNLMSRNS